MRGIVMTVPQQQISNEGYACGRYHRCRHSHHCSLAATCKRELSRVFQICVLLQGGSTRPGWGSVQGMLSNP